MNPFNPPPLAPPVAPVEPGPLKHSGFGIASFGLSLVVGFLMLLTIGVAGYLEVTTPGGMSEESPVAIVVGLAIFLFAAIDLVSLGLGIAGLIQKDRKKVFAVLGTIFATLTLVGTFALMVIGMVTGS